MTGTGVIHLLFGFTGRIGRARYWLGQLLQWAFLLVVVFALAIVDALDPAVLESDAARITVTIVLVAVLVIILLSQLALSVKRAHDRERTGVWAILMLFLALFVPFLGIWLLIWLGFLRGSTGPNQYGPDPLAASEIRKASEAIRRNPNDARAYLTRGANFAFARDFDRAVEDFDKAIALAPKDYEAFNNRAYVFLMRNKLDRAIADYDVSLQLAPMNAEALFGRGTAKLRMSDPAGDSDISAAKWVRRTIAHDMARVGIR